MVVCLCVCVEKKLTFVTGCVHSWDLRPIRCSDWHQISFGAAVDAAVNPQYLELLTTRTEAQRARLMFEKRCVQERWEVSEDGGTLCFHQQTSVGCIFRAWVRSSPDVVCVRIISGLFVVRYKLCDLWSHRPLKPAAALTEASDKKKKTGNTWLQFLCLQCPLSNLHGLHQSIKRLKSIHTTRLNSDDRKLHTLLWSPIIRLVFWWTTAASFVSSRVTWSIVLLNPNTKRDRFQSSVRPTPSNTCYSQFDL